MGEGEDGHRSLRGTGWSSARLGGRLPHHHRCGGCALSDMDEMFHIEVGDLHHRPNTLLDQNMILSIAAFIIKTFICGLCLDFVPFQGEKYLFLIADMVCSVPPALPRSDYGASAVCADPQPPGLLPTSC